MRAIVIHAIGEDLLTRGDTDGAARKFREAHDITAALLEREPDNPVIIFAHAQSEYWLGRVHQVRGAWAEAAAHYSRYGQAAERLVAIAPGRVDYLLEAAFGASNLGQVELHGRRDPVRARGSFRKALAWLLRAERMSPRDERLWTEEANVHAWIGDTFFAEEVWHLSLQSRRRQLAILERLRAAHPADMHRLYQVALAQRGVASHLTRLEDREGARNYFWQALENARTLTAHDPANADWLFLRGAAACALLYAGLTGEGTLSAIAVRGDATAAAATLAAQQNPNSRELNRCVAAV